MSHFLIKMQQDHAMSQDGGPGFPRWLIVKSLLFRGIRFSGNRSISLSNRVSPGSLELHNFQGVVPSADKPLSFSFNA